MKYLRPGRGGATVRVELSTVHVGNSSFRQVYRVRDEHGGIWAEGQAVLVCYDEETGRSRAIPGPLRETLEALMG